MVSISVVIPAYNSERYIRETLTSVARQSVTADELIVVDNNCTDNTVEIAREMGAAVISETKQNISASRNAGIRHARSDWIALLDHDDLWEPDKLRHQLELIKLYPETRVVGGQMILKIEENSFAGPPLPDPPQANRTENFYEYFPRIDADFFRHHRLHTSGLLIHREVFARCGFYDERFPPQEDVEFIYRILARYGLGYVHLPLSQYRLHQTNTIRFADKVLESTKLIVEEIHSRPGEYIPGGKELISDYLKQVFVSSNHALAQESRKNKSPH